MKKLIFGLIAMFSLQVMAEFVVPATPHPVNDYAGVLTESAKNSIAHKLILLKEATGAQGGVLIVNSLDGTAIEDASMKVATAWKLGAANADSGVLLMLSIKDHKSRLEIGRGLEGLLTDADSKRILANMRSDLRSGNYASAIAGAIDATSGIITAHKEEIMTKPTGSNSGTNLSLFFLIVGFGGLFGLLGYFVFRKKKVVEETPDSIQTYTGVTPTYHGGEVPARPVKAHKASGDTTIIAPVIISNHTDYGGYSSSSSDSSSSSSDNSSSWSGGGGDFSGGGSSDSW